MSTTLNVGQNIRFKFGWIILLIAAGLMTLNHVSGIFYLGNPVLFMGYAAFTAYALVVIALPFRRREQWAWYTTWLLPIGLAAPAALTNDSTLVALYGAFAALCVLGLLLTMQDFFVLNRKI